MWLVLTILWCIWTLEPKAHSDTAVSVYCDIELNDPGSEVTDKPVYVIEVMHRPIKNAVAKFRPPLRSKPIVDDIRPPPIAAPLNISQQQPQSPAQIQIPIIPSAPIAHENVSISGPPGVTNPIWNASGRKRKKKEPKKKESKSTKFDYFAGLTLQQASMVPLTFGWNKINSTPALENLLCGETAVQVAIENDVDLAQSRKPSSHTEQAGISTATIPTDRSSGGACSGPWPGLYAGHSWCATPSSGASWKPHRSHLLQDLLLQRLVCVQCPSS